MISSLASVTTDVIALGPADAAAVGRLLARAGAVDVVDAHVVVCARRGGQRVITSEPGDLARLDPARTGDRLIDAAAGRWEERLSTVSNAEGGVCADPPGSEPTVRR